MRCRILWSPPLIAAATVLLLASCATSNHNDIPRLHGKVNYGELMGRSVIEGRRSFTGTLTIHRSPPTDYISWFTKTKRDKIELEIAGTDGQSSKASFPHEAKFDAVIDPRKEYRVDLLTEISSRAEHGTYVSDEVERMWDGESVIVDASRCRVHQLEMRRELDGRDSAEGYSRRFFLAREKTFPNDGISYLCCGTEGHNPVWKCPACEAAYEQQTEAKGAQ